MWFYRRLLRISWTKHRTNASVLERLNVFKKELLGKVKLTKMGYYGRVVRKYSSLEKEVIQGCTSGSRSHNRQRRRWTDDVSEWSAVWLSSTEQQWQKTELSGEGSYVPTILHTEDSTRWRQNASWRFQHQLTATLDLLLWKIAHWSPMPQFGFLKHLIVTS